MPIRHYHLGAGALGLGLVLPALSQVCNSSIVASRSSTSGGKKKLSAIAQSGSYRLDVYSPRGKNDNSNHTVAVAHAISYDELPGHLTLGFANVDAIIVTTALKKAGVNGSVDQLKLICESAHRCNIPILLLAAENEVDSCYVHQLLINNGCDDKNIYPVRCVVDRICNKPIVEANGPDKGKLTVLVEQFAKIYLNHEDLLSSVPDVLRKAMSSEAATAIFEETDDFQFIVERKKWVVNASHLLLALYAHWSNYPSLQGFVQNNTNVVERLVDDVVSMSRGSLLAGVSPAVQKARAMKGFATDLKTRLGQFPQFTYDVVTRFTGSEQLLDFFHDFHRKIVEPYLALPLTVDNRVKTPVLPSYITMCLIELIHEKRWIKPPRPVGG